MLSQVTGALVRALLVMVLVATPSALLPGTGADGRQMAALVALVAAALTFIEYSARTPVLIEFRDAPPYNRTRFLMLFAMLVLLSMALRQGEQSALASLAAEIAHLCGRAFDFPYSPVRLVTILFAQGAPPETAAAVRAAAGAAYMIALMSLPCFVAVLRMQGWPSGSGAFNVWVNLPTFDPTAGGDVVARLDRDARVNLGLGLVLPFVIPAVIKAGGMGLGALDMGAPQTLTWTIAAWAFLPASLCMRGIAMMRIAGMIRARRQAGEATTASGYVAV